MFYKIINYIKNAYKAWTSLIILNNLSFNMKKIIFYVEDSSDWGHLNSIINYLIILKQNVLRITSDPNDKFLQHQNTYFIGSGSARTYLFRTIKAKSIVMTLADLNTFYLKRSIHPVHYFYVFHSIASTHRVYREYAFDAYDTIFCVGEHHIKEIRKTEQVYNLSKKNLVKYGYGRLDNLLMGINNNHILNKKKDTLHHVLIAPSWGKSSIVNKHLIKLIKILIANNYKVTLRLHPMTQRQKPNLTKELIKKFESSDNYFFDADISSEDSLLDSDIMISEWSGAALEFAFSREKPVIFIDTSPKINNLNWKKINLPCLEEEIRNDIGKVISIKDIEKIPKIIVEVLNNVNFWSSKIRNKRKSTVFNIGDSGKIGAKIICKTLSLN